MENNKTNIDKLHDLENKIKEFLKKGNYKSLLLEIELQDGVIQVMRVMAADKRDFIKI